MKNLAIVKTFLHEDCGQDLIEYALIAAVVALGAVTALSNVASAITTAFTNIGTTLTTAG
jgi:pilus assembly protein Flp/PilA